MRFTVGFIPLAVLLFAACGDEPAAPRTGDLQVSVVTTGGDPDEDGYVLIIDGEHEQTVGMEEIVEVPALDAGAHSVELTGVAANCTVDGSNPATASITAGSLTELTFAVACAATGVHISVTTTGADIDQDGYTVSLNDAESGTIPATGTLTLTRLAVGEHSVALLGAAGNCTIASPTEVTVSVDLGEVEEVGFAASCVATTGSLLVSTATTGIDLDVDGYAVSIDGGAPRPMPRTGNTVFEGLSPGEHTITVEGASPNCSIADGPVRTADVTVGGTTRDTATVAFAVTCGAATGSIEVTLETTGQDRDPNGYTLRVNDGSPRIVTRDGRTVFEGLDAGPHTVVIDDVISNCVVAGGSTRTVTVTTGGQTRDTARTTLSIACEPVWSVVFVRLRPDYYYEIPTITLASGDGSQIVSTRDGEEPDWSPDGERIVYRELRDCGDYYGCNPVGLSVMSADGSGNTSLTTNTSDDEPDLSPDGERIAFTREINRRQLFLMAANGSAQTMIPLPTMHSVAVPAWSPDGNRLAFECEVDQGNVDICVVAVDGGGFQRLTTAAEDEHRPSWSPDGTRLGFTTLHQGRQALATMNADGSNVMIVASETGVLQPAWLPEGARIVFVEFVCDIYAGCTILGLSAIDSDGTGKVRLTSSREHRVPDWRP